MNFFFLAIVVLEVLGVGVAIGKDGEPKEEKYSGGSRLIAATLELVLVYFAIKHGF